MPKVSMPSNNKAKCYKTLLYSYFSYRCEIKLKNDIVTNISDMLYYLYLGEMRTVYGGFFKNTCV